MQPLHWIISGLRSNSCAALRRLKLAVLLQGHAPLADVPATQSLQVSKDVQTLFQYIEDADLWRWKLPNSKQFHAGLGEMKLEYDVQKNPAIFDQLCKLKADDIIDKASASAPSGNPIRVAN